MQRLVVLTALWHRHDLARLMLEHTLAIARECNGFKVEVHAIVSPDEDPESLTLATSLGIECTAAPNQPLGAKWNAGMKTLLERMTQPDAVMILGSDDWVTVEILRAAACAIFEKEADFVGFLDFFFLTHGPRAAFWPGYSEASGRKGETISTARTFSRRLLDIIRWAPWPGHLQRGLDGASWAKVQAARHFFDEVAVKALSCVAVGGMILDVKPAGSKAISSVESYFAESTEIDWTVIASKFPAPMVAAWNLDPLPEFVRRRNATVHEGGARLALTMIAKNAQGTIERAIRTALPVIDIGVVVLDDRTSDRTADIAAALGMNVIRHAWEGFGAQRRFVHDIAAHARWHLVLDADETLEPGDLLAAIERAEAEDADAVLVTLLAQTQGGTIPQMQVRVLRAGRARWVFRRHNDLRGVKKTVLSTAVVHQSYVGVVTDRASASIPDLLEMWENPSEPGVPESEERAHAACFLSQAYGALGDWAAVELWTSRCMALDPDKKYPEAAARWALARALTLHTDALPDIHEMIEQYPGMADLEHLAGSLHLARWFLGCVNPGRYANRAQTTMPYLRNAQAAFEALGFALSFREPTEAEAAATEKAGRAQA